jgi:hypothetical protein
MGKKDRTYFRTLPWESLKRWVKYGTDSDTNWQELAIVLVERADEEREDAYDKGRGDNGAGYHHWDSN